MKNNLVDAINKAIENGSEVNISISTQELNGMNIHMIPDYIDVSDAYCVLFHDTDIVTVNLANVEFDDILGEFICSEKNSSITISV